MNFEILNYCEDIFREIALFYIKWNGDPEAIIEELDKQNSTKQKLESSIIKRQAVIDANSEIVLSWLRKSFIRTPWVWDSHIDKLHFKGKTKPLPLPYKLTGHDVHKWLYFDRILKLSDDIVLIKLYREISEIDINTRTIRVQSFLDLLDSLKIVIAQFEKSLNSLINNSFIIANSQLGDWQDIGITLRDLTDNHIKPLIRTYTDKIKIYSQVVRTQPLIKGNKIIGPSISSLLSTQSKIFTFPELLAGKFSKDDLDNLLIHLHMKDHAGQNIWPQGKKSALYGVINALVLKNFLIQTPRKVQMASLSTYLGLSQTRVKEGYSRIQIQTKEKAISYLNKSIKSEK
jgi:hypothetical protein